ncbi:MAG: hypothetical protein H0W15_00510 [Gemmatimonadales bacterium]|nr:hypothetical protein [Gemmatimonadales bacterium]
MTRRFARPACRLLLMLQVLTGCTSWKVETVSPQATLDKKTRDEVQVRETSGERYVLAMPTIRNDTMSGFIGTRARHVALAAIDRIAVRKTNTAAIIIVGMVVVAGIMALAAKDQCFTGCGTGPLFGGRGPGAH